MESWSLSRELLIPAETITGSRLETEFKKEKKEKNLFPFSWLSIQPGVVGVA